VLIAEQKSPNSFDKTMYYRINYEKLDLESIPPKWGNRKPQNGNVSNTETTRDYFGEFWKAYPKKVAKEDAISAWRKIKLDDILFTKMLKAIKDQKLSETEKQFIPNPATWLNAKRWEDEVIATQKPIMGWK
jgi:hypothetical protein